MSVCVSVLSLTGHTKRQPPAESLQACSDLVCVCEPLWLCSVVTVYMYICKCIIWQDGDSDLRVVYEHGDKNLTDPADSTIWESSIPSNILTNDVSSPCLECFQHLHFKSKIPYTAESVTKPCIYV